jgi:predicted kinase
MSKSDVTLHLVCGKIAAGKSTLTAKLATTPNTVLISEDRWLSILYRGEMNNVADYVRVSPRLREAIGPHVESLLKLGVSVVLDFPANTVANRAWMRGLFERGGARHQLHFLDAPDAVCKARLHARNRAGGHDFAPSDETFAVITRYFVPPSDEEGFNVVRYPISDDP